MSKLVTRFSRQIPHWQPRVEPVKLADASAAQRDALKVTPSNKKVSEYSLVLAHDPEILKVRSPLFNAIMYDKGGLGRTERELGALAASVVNQCIYCAAVHASRHAQLSRDDSVTDRIFAQGKDAELDSRDLAIFKFAISLTQSPVRIGPQHLSALQDAGLDRAEVLDLILSTALFSWANRLMHILGDPVDVDSLA